MRTLLPHEDQRFQRDVEHLYSLGDRATAEFLAEVARRIGGMPAIQALLVEYRALSPTQVRAAGGDRFPPRALRRVA